MSSRQEQKERRRREREERERAERAAERRKRLGGIVGGTAIVAAVIVGVVLAVSGGGGDGGPESGAQDGPAPGGLPVPPQRQPELAAAVAAAGCAFREFEEEGNEHVTEARTPADYQTNPPTSGNHNPVPAEDGFYPPGTEPPLANWVHTLEHGRIVLQYRNVPRTFERRLRTLFNEPVAGGPERYHMVLMRNNTNMEYKVAAVAWTRAVVCRQVNNRTFDALRAFRDQFVDQGPEQVP